jgi:hypothetical protein
MMVCTSVAVRCTEPEADSGAAPVGSVVGSELDPQAVSMTVKAKWIQKIETAGIQVRFHEVFSRTFIRILLPG